MAIRYTIAEIAKHLNATSQSVAQAVRCMGVYTTTENEKISSRNAEKIMRAYRLWKASKQGSAFGISKELILAASSVRSPKHKRAREKARSAYLERDLESLLQDRG
jgi:hypothetical protein